MPKQGWHRQGDERGPGIMLPFLPKFSSAGSPQSQVLQKHHTSVSILPSKEEEKGKARRTLRFLSFEGQYLQNLLEVEWTPHSGTTKKKELTVSPCQCHYKTLSLFETGGFTWSIFFRIINSSSQFILYQASFSSQAN